MSGTAHLAAGRAPRRWLARFTLRTRLIAGLLTLLALACAVVGGATYLAASRFLLIQLDSQLQASAQLYAAACQKHGGPPPAMGNPPQGGPNAPGCGSFPGQAQNTLDASLHGGRFTSHNVVSGQCVLNQWEKNTLAGLPADGQPHTVNLPSLKASYRLVANTTAGGDVLVTGLPMTSMNATLHDLLLTELAVFGGVLVLAGVLGTGLVRISLRPLRRVAATASQVTELPLADGSAALPVRVLDINPRTEVGQVAVAFNRMLGHVESALAKRASSEARLRRFAADASHELRTPLAAIRGYAELALRHPGDSPETVTHALGRVLSESTRMSVLVDDLLLLARLDAGRPLNREPVDMTRLAIDATSDARVARPGHRWMLELPDDPLVVSGDEHRLHQVLANLLSNAGRHTPEGTTVTVTVSGELPPGEPGAGPDSARHGAVPAGPLVVAAVTDDGPGIPPGLLPDLFERFTRADTSRSHAADANSTGLGLAIVDAVVAALGGAVLVTSRPGLTRFTVVLSRLAEPAAPQPRARPGRRSLHKS